MDITPLSLYQNEKESLLAPGTKLKVVRVRVRVRVRVGIPNPEPDPNQVVSRKRVGSIAEIAVEEVGS